MSLPTQTILLLDHRPVRHSLCRNSLATLGYHRVVFVNYTLSDEMPPASTRIDAVLAVWTDFAIDLLNLTRLVGEATTHARSGALVISPFSTQENAAMLRTAGARAWLRYPFTKDQLGQRLQFMFEGERRQRLETVQFERRREPVYPMAAVA